MTDDDHHFKKLNDTSLMTGSDEELEAAIYARTSSSSQEFGYSIDGQVRRCRTRCEQMGWPVTHVFCDEAISGKDTDRPMFQQLLSRGRAGAIDVVVIWKLDRFSRSLMHAVQLERDFRDWGVAMHSVTENLDTTTPTGRFNFRSISSASEFERDLNKQRTAMGMKELALERKWPNKQPPLGYRKLDEGTLEIVATEAELVRNIFETYIERKSMPTVAEELNKEGYRTKSGLEWTTSSVGRILRNDLYVGNYDVAGIQEYVSEYHLLDRELFEEATSVRMRFQRDTQSNRDKMPAKRKEKRVQRIADQFQEFLNEDYAPNRRIE